VRTQNKCPFVTSHLLFYLAQVNIDTVNIVKVGDSPTVTIFTVSDKHIYSKS